MHPNKEHAMRGLHGHRFNTNGLPMLACASMLSPFRE
jgi:hypothetical protein